MLYTFLLPWCQGWEGGMRSSLPATRRRRECAGRLWRWGPPWRQRWGHQPRRLQKVGHSGAGHVVFFLLRLFGFDHRQHVRILCQIKFQLMQVVLIKEVPAILILNLLMTFIDNGAFIKILHETLAIKVLFSLERFLSPAVKMRGLKVFFFKILHKEHILIFFYTQRKEKWYLYHQHLTWSLDSTRHSETHRSLFSAGSEALLFPLIIVRIS